MGKGGGGKGGTKPKRGRGHRTGTLEEFMERNEGATGEDRPKRPQEEEDDNDDEEEQGDAGKKEQRIVLERDDDLEAELAQQFGTTELTRKQREQLEEEERLRQEEKAAKDGSTDQAKADMERLAEVRARREEAAKQREKEKAEAEKKAAEQAAKVEAEDKQREVAVAIAKLVQESADKKLTINQLNQDAACKKVLKPLCKKYDVKAMNRQWLEKFMDLYSLKEEGSTLAILPKGSK